MTKCRTFKHAFLILLLPIISLPLQVSANTFPPNTHYQVCFTPGENCTRLITDHIYNAKKSIEMQGYSFTSYRIAKALIRMHKRGIAVRVILDKSNFNPQNKSRAKMLLQAGIPVWNDNQLNIAHNKVLIIDGHIVETGSFNYTYSAQKYNAENVLIIDNQALAQAYLKNWERREMKSKKVNRT